VFILNQVKVLFPPRHNIGHFGDVLQSQSLGLVLKKLNLTQHKQTTQQNGKNTQKANLNLNQQSTLQTAYTRVHIIVHNCQTQHSTEQF